MRHYFCDKIGFATGDFARLQANMCALETCGSKDYDYDIQSLDVLNAFFDL